MQRMRFHSCFYTGIALNLLCFATKIGNILTVFYNDLIAASSQCKIDCGTGMFITSIIRRTLDTNTDTQCYRHLIADLYGLDIFENTEFVIHHWLEIFVFKYDKIFVFFDFAHQRIHLCKILVYFSVYQSDQKRTFYILNTVECFIIVVDIHKRCDLLLLFVFLLVVAQFCLIKQIQCRKKFFGIVHFNRLTLIHDIIKIDTIKRNSKNPLLHGNLNVLWLLILLQEFPCDRGKKRRDRFVILPADSRQFRKLLIYPKNLARIIQQGIRYLKLIEQPLLHRGILCGKVNDLIGQMRLIVIIQTDLYCKINYNKSRQHDACGNIIEVKSYICQYQRNRQQKRPTQIRP